VPVVKGPKAENGKRRDTLGGDKQQKKEIQEEKNCGSVEMVYIRSGEVCESEKKGREREKKYY
jgi:hypothetical protein